MLIYCDESAHLQNDKINTMVLGALRCEDKYKREIFNNIRKIKEQHGLSPYFEIKWTKVSMGKIDFYLDIIKYILDEDNLSFRGVVARKDNLNLKHHCGDYNTWYYKMYYFLLRDLVYDDEISIYVDVKDTKGGPRVRELRKVLSNSAYDFEMHRIKRIQQIHSHESEILQVVDLIIGAINYKHRRLESNQAKLMIIDFLESNIGHLLTQSANRNEGKFNIFCLEYGGLK